MLFIRKLAGVSTQHNIKKSHVLLSDVFRHIAICLLILMKRAALMILNL